MEAELDACAAEAKLFVENIQNNAHRKLHFDLVVPVSRIPELGGEAKTDVAMKLTERVWNTISGLRRFEVIAIVTYEGSMRQDDAPEEDMMLFRIHLVDPTVVPASSRASAPVA